MTIEGYRRAGVLQILLGIIIFVLVLAANLLSDAIRDAFDPRVKERSA